MNNVIRYFIISATTLGLFFGIIFYSFFHHILYVSRPTSWHIASQSLAEKKTCSIEVWNGKELKKNISTLVGNNPQDLLALAIKQWLLHLGEEIPGLQNIQLQSSMLDNHQQDLFLSFDSSFLKLEWSIEQKLLLIESLQKTLHSLCPSLTSISYNVHHKPLHDSQLSFEHSWPIAGFSGTKNETFSLNYSGSTIIIDHTGDERERGREIDNNYEYHITSYITDTLLHALNQRHFDASPLRKDNEWYDQEKKQRLLNRLNPTLFIHISAYAQEERSFPILNLYYYCNDPVKDFWHCKNSNAWILQKQAHCANLATTSALAESLYKTLVTNSSSWRIKRPCCLPSCIIEGIRAPSLVIEMGLPNAKAWESIIDPLAHALETLLLD
jgi:hypothetical protein